MVAGERGTDDQKQTIHINSNSKKGRSGEMGPVEKQLKTRGPNNKGAESELLLSGTTSYNTWIIFL